MKSTVLFTAMIIALTAVFSILPLSAEITRQEINSIRMPDGVKTSAGLLQFFDGVPSPFTAEKLYNYLDKMRAVATYLNTIPVASMDAILKGARSIGADSPEKVVIFEEPVTSKSLLLTGDPHSVYMYTFLDTGLFGPTVAELPPHSFGAMNDMWGLHITDTGVSGPDRGNGGKYLVLPPDFDIEDLKTDKNGKAVDIENEYIIVRAKTLKVWLFLFGITEKDNRAEIVDSFKTMKIYPYGSSENSSQSMPSTGSKHAANRERKPMQFINGSAIAFNSVFPGDISFYKAVNDVVQSEPADSMNPELLGLLATIGIKKGEKFNPQGRMAKILSESAIIGDAISRTLLYRPRNKTGRLYEDSNSWWMTGFPAHENSLLLNKGVKNINGRTMFHYAFSGITSAMSETWAGLSTETGLTSGSAKPEIKRGMAFATAFVDSKGRALNGRKTYKLHLPPAIPAAKGWSVTIYDTQFRSLVDVNGQPIPSISSSDNPVKNSDGSIDIFFSSREPKGANRIRTRWSKGWFAVLRLYHPLKPWFDHSWRPGDIHLQR